MQLNDLLCGQKKQNKFKDSFAARCKSQTGSQKKAVKHQQKCQIIQGLKIYVLLSKMHLMMTKMSVQ